MSFPPNFGSELLKILHESFHPRSCPNVPHMRLVIPGQGPDDRPRNHLRRTNLRHRPSLGRENKHSLSAILKNLQCGGCQLHVHSSRVTQTTWQLVNSSVRWLLHVCKRPFALSAAEHGVPCVSPCSQQDSAVVGFLALAFTCGRFFVLGTALRVRVAFALLCSFALALVLFGRRALSFPLASARGQAVF